MKNLDMDLGTTSLMDESFWELSVCYVRLPSGYILEVLLLLRRAVLKPMTMFSIPFFFSFAQQQSVCQSVFFSIYIIYPGGGKGTKCSTAVDMVFPRCCYGGCYEGF